MTYKEVVALAKELGGDVEHGINWIWSHFPTQEAAKEFHSRLGPKVETRGVYPDASVRWRL